MSSWLSTIKGSAAKAFKAREELSELFVDDIDLLKAMASVQRLREISKSLVQETNKYRRSLEALVHGGGKMVGAGGGIAFAETLARVGETSVAKGIGSVPALQPSEDHLADLKYVLKVLGAAEARSHAHINSFVQKLPQDVSSNHSLMETQYKNVVKPLKVEYRTAKHEWAALKNEGSSTHRVGGAPGSSGSYVADALDSGDKVDVRNAELQWRAVSPKLFKAARDLLEEFAPRVTESMRRFAAAQSRCFGMAAGELQPLDKSLTPRTPAGSKSVLSFPSKLLSRVGTSGAPSSADAGGSSIQKPSTIARVASISLDAPPDSVVSEFAPNVTNSDGTWGAPIPDYNPFSSAA